jgi:hypothetical protein
MQSTGARTACEFIRDLKRTTQRMYFVGLDLRMARAPWYLPHQDGVAVKTPIDNWYGGCGVTYTCSLCDTRSGGPCRVDFNPVLPRPYVITCGRCQVKNDTR